MQQNEEIKPSFADELQKMQHEPLLPVERSLIVWSLLLGVVLIVGFSALSHYLLRN